MVSSGVTPSVGAEGHGACRICVLRPFVLARDMVVDFPCCPVHRRRESLGFRPPSVSFARLRD